MDFGTSYSRGVEAKPCVICGKGVEPADKVVVEKEIIHGQCFKCGFCDGALKHGSCAMTRTPYGVRWYCSGTGTPGCALKNRAEKEAKLKEKGAQLVKK